MATANPNQFNQDIFVDYDIDEFPFDPLADDSFDHSLDNVLKAEGYVGDPSLIAPKSVVPPAPELTPVEKIEELFKKMIPFKRYLLSILDFCRETKGFEELDVFVEDLQSHRRTVYSTGEFCMMLEEAEGLEKITEDGTPYEDVPVEPVEVEVDGKVYLEPGEPPTPYWRTTEGGLEVLGEDNPIKVLQEVFEREAQYKSAFVQILELCSGEGSSITVLREKVNANPVLHYPQKAVNYFLDFLDRNAAVEWDGTWKITAIGERVLELLRAEGEE